MGARLFGRMSAAGFVVAAACLTYAPPALAAPPTCTAPAPQSVIVGDVLFFDPADVCSDMDADALTYAVTTAPQHGTADFDGEFFEYTPAPPYSGPDSFSFTATGGGETTAPVTVSITVEANQPPVCPTEIDIEVEPDVPSLFDPYFECDDDLGDLTFNVVDPPVHGTIGPYDLFEGFTYEPTTGYRGPDTFTVRANDGLSDSELVTVNVTVLAPNRVPHCVTPVTVEVGVGGSIPLDYGAVCTDPDGDPLSPRLVSGPSHGTLELDLPTITYHAAAGYRGSDRVVYYVSDDRGGQSNTAVANIRVGPPLPTFPLPRVDTTAPTFAIARAGSAKLGSVRKRGLRLNLTCDEAGSMSVEVSVTKAAARKLRIKPKAKGRVIIGRASKAVTAGENEITVKLSRRARKRLARARTVKLRLLVRVVDVAGNLAADTLRVTLRR